MNSISVRLLLAALVVLSLFISITLLTIQRAVDSRSEQGQFARLQGQAYALLGASDIDPYGTVTVAVEELPNPLMSQPGSGEYAEIRGLSARAVWSSPSLTSPLPNDSEGAIGEWRFGTEQSDAHGLLFVLRFAVEWQLADGSMTPYQYVLASNREQYDQRREQFNSNVSLAMLSMGGLLLMLMTLILAWGLRPLRRLTRQLREVEAGEREHLPDRVPVELRPLTGSINALIATERARRKKYRNTLDDLAHSLKTPLSVIRNSSAAMPGDSGTELDNQPRRMEQIISYHIKRADAGSRRLLTPAIALAATTSRMVATMQKVYRDRSVTINMKLSEQDAARIEEADWMELVGNLLDNACKYGARQIDIHAQDNSGLKTNRVRVHIDDDGPGFPAELREQLLDRGVRADTRQDGQGIGLAVARELCESYGGELSLAGSPLGGARVSIELPGGI